MNPLKSHKKCCKSRLDILRHEIERGMSAKLSIEKYVHKYETLLAEEERRAATLWSPATEGP